MGERKRRHFETIGVDPTAPDRTEVRFRDESPHPGPTEAPGIDIRDGVGAEAGPPGVGDLLRGCRQAQGYDLADVAAALRIRHAYLQAIEDGRFKDLPGATYAAGFLRTYAEFLDLDPQEVVRRFKDEVSGAMPRTELYLPRPVPEGRAPGGAVLLVAVMLAGSVYGGWYYLSSTGRRIQDLVPPVPERLATALNLPAIPAAPAVIVPVPRSAEAPTPESAAAQPAPPLPVQSAMVAAAPNAVPVPTIPPGAGPVVPVPPAAISLAPVPTISPGSVPPGPVPPGSFLLAGAGEAAAPDGAVPPVAFVPPKPSLGSAQAAMPPNPAVSGQPAPTGKVYGVTGPESRIQIRAVQESWIQVRDGTGELLFTRNLRVGDVYRAPDRTGLRLVTGNAGGVVISIDGADVPSLGSQGQVLRDVPIDAQHLPGRAAAAN